MPPPYFFPPFLHTGSLCAFTHNSLHPWLQVGSGCQNGLIYNHGELSLEMHKPPGAAINQWLVSVNHINNLASWPPDQENSEVRHTVSGWNFVQYGILGQSFCASFPVSLPTSLSILLGDALNNKQILLLGSGELKECSLLSLVILAPRQIYSCHTQCPQ